MRLRLAFKFFFVAVVAAAAASVEAAAADNSTPAPAIARIDVGIKHYFKVGYWTPIRIDVQHAEGLDKARVEVTVPDSDGVPTTASAPLSATGSGQRQRTAVVYTRVGRVNSEIRVSLLDGDRRLDERAVRPRAGAKSDSAPVSLPATAELLVSFGPTAFGLKNAFPDREGDAGQLARQIIELNQVADLPTDWFAYEAVDVVVINGADGKLCRELAANALRIEALTRWVELGGRLVVLCGSQSGPELLAKDGALARFSPGQFAEVVRFPETGPIERFAGSAAPISLAPGMVLRVPRLADVKGNVEVYGGKQASEIPLVVRSLRGLGEIAFVGLDFNQPPLAEWSGRSTFLQALLHPYLTNISSSATSQRLVTRGYNDLSGALRQQLGQSFPSVKPIGFGMVAGLAIAYILFLGPVDYLLVNRWFRRPGIAWVSFPLIVLAFCGAAMALASWRNGASGSRANRLELVDVDTIAGRARGTLWTTLYSPTATQFDLSVDRSPADADSAGGREVLLSWWGLPGVGIGGMQSGGVDLGIVHSGYFYGPEKKSLQNVPVLASATKSLMTRWIAPVPHMVDAKLANEDGLAVGSITNMTGMTLKNVRLLYGTWAYRLGTLDVGQSIEVGDQLNPRKVKTIVTHDAMDEANAAKGMIEGAVFDAEQASAKEILNLMMFYDAAGGLNFAHLPNRYQAYCDLSRVLELGRAVLVAEAATPVMRLLDDVTGNAIGDKQDESTVVYRFVLPVERSGSP